MARQKFDPKHIIMKLREVVIPLGKGFDVPVACQAVGISQPSYYRWRKEQGGMKIDQEKKYKELKCKKEIRCQTFFGDRRAGELFKVKQ